jgi:hypothetical protein
MKKPSNTKAAPYKKKPAGGAYGAKKKRKSAMKPRRNVTVPQFRPKESDSSVENLRLARFGAELPEAVAIYELTRQIPGEREPNQTALAKHLAGLICRAVASGQDEVLHSLARLSKSPVALPSDEVAMEWRDEAQLYAGGHRPRSTRAEVTANIQDRTGCDARTAEKAIARAGLSVLFKWKAGRPKKSTRAQS